MTLIKSFFPTIDELEAYLGTKNYLDQGIESLKVIIKVGYLNDLLAEPRAVPDRRSIDSYFSYLERCYLRAKLNRTSTRVGQPMGTVADPVVTILLKTRFNFTDEEVEIISSQHRMSMIAENLVGDLLEDYLEEKLRPFGWVCCYGQLLKYSDFCHPNNQILQVKNRDNTENSSSKKIRDRNPNISLWFRTFCRTGQTNWNHLYTMLSIDRNAAIFSEENFHQFVIDRITANPSLISEE